MKGRDGALALDFLSEPLAADAGTLSIRLWPCELLGRLARRDETGLVGVDHGLDAVA
jgi:hypothetical protein